MEKLEMIRRLVDADVHPRNEWVEAELYSAIKRVMDDEVECTEEALVELIQHAEKG